MAVPIQTPLISYTADGTTTVFPYKFYTTEYTDLIVQVAGQRQTTGFTVTGMGNTNGGDVTFSSAPAAGAEVVIFRETAVGRSAEYQDNGDLLAADINRDFDKIWLVQQEQKASNAANLSRPVGGGAWDAQKYQITNVLPGTHPTDVVTYGQMTTLNNSASNAATTATGAANRAATSERAAGQSALDAAAAAQRAQNAETAATQAAQTAGADANTAATTAINTLINPQVKKATDAATDAAGYAQDALTNKNTAGSSAAAAHTSELNAASAETNAKGWAAAAKQSADAAAQSASDAATAAASVNVTAINQSIAGKVDQSAYDREKANFTTATSLGAALANYATKSDVTTAVGNVTLPTDLPSTELGKTNTWLATNIFAGKVSVNKIPSDATDVVNKSYFDSIVQTFPTADNTAVKDADNRFTAKQTFTAGITVGAVPGQPINDNDVVGKKWITDYVTTTLNQAPAASNVVTTDGVQEISAGKTIKAVWTFSGLNSGITVDSANPPRFILDRAGSVTVPEPSTAKQAASKNYVDTTIANYPEMVTRSTEQEIDGRKQFNGNVAFKGSVSFSGKTLDLTGAPLVAVPDTDLSNEYSAATRKYVDEAVKNASGTAANMVTTDGAQDIKAKKTFSGGVDITGASLLNADIKSGTGAATAVVDLSGFSSVTVPTPGVDGSAATKKYVDDNASPAKFDIIEADLANPFNIEGAVTAVGDGKKAYMVFGPESAFRFLPGRPYLPRSVTDILQFIRYQTSAYGQWIERIVNTATGAEAIRFYDTSLTPKGWTAVGGGSTPAANVVTTDGAEQIITKPITLKNTMLKLAGNSVIEPDSIATKQASVLLDSIATVTVPEPRIDSSASTKKYVDDLINRIAWSRPVDPTVTVNPHVAEDGAWFIVGANIKISGGFTLPSDISPSADTGYYLLEKISAGAGGNQQNSGYRLTEFSTGKCWVRTEIRGQMSAWQVVGVTP